MVKFAECIEYSLTNLFIGSFKVGLDSKVIHTVVSDSKCFLLRRALLQGSVIVYFAMHRNDDVFLNNSVIRPPQ